LFFLPLVSTTNIKGEKKDHEENRKEKKRIERKKRTEKGVGIKN